MARVCASKCCSVHPIHVLWNCSCSFAAVFTTCILTKSSDCQLPRLCNVLPAVWQGELVMIDVSQSVDLDHPRALHFLREDIQHVNAFFQRAGVPTLTMRELFDFVLNACVTPDSMDAEVQRLMDLAARRGCGLLHGL